MAVKSKISKSSYGPSKIESKWQSVWEKEGIFSPNLDKAKKPYYNLMMFPYPSAEGLHVGNMYAFTGADVWGRFMRMQGYDVFEPIGLDGFGIHSENYAIRVGEHPAKLAKKTEKRFYAQLRATGNAYDWRRTLETYDPDYYRWTQWIFVQMFKRGLAYRKKSPVNWCPSCKTVLADEQVIGGRCERCDQQVEKRELEQWFFKITDYADKLLEDLARINWSEKVKIAQRNWIGRKEGITIRYKVLNSRFRIGCWTSRPDTNFGATFIVLAPEHPLALKLADSQNKKKVQEYIRISKNKSEQERIAEGREKTGVFTGVYALNELTGEKMPIWVSDFVLMGFGTGAVVGVPGHDRRDFQFAQKFGLPIKRVVVGRDGDSSPITAVEQVQEEEGTMINSGFLDGMDIGKAKEKIIDYLEEKGWGERKVTYHLRDWLISRQRYWGPPIPMICCPECAHSASSGQGWQPVPERDLPVLLPDIKNWKPTGTGESPLAQDKDWVRVACPKCGGIARRETDVSDNFLDNAWYFFRYTSTEFPDRVFDKARVKKWLPVHMYIGGAEHSVLHLLYARFLTMVLSDWGLISFDEPFKRFYAHGLLIKDGAKMSKSRGNVVIPDEYIKKFGADTLRTYLMFLGPFDQGGDFRDTGIEGMYRFLKRVWELVNENKDVVLEAEKDSREVLRAMHKAIKRVTEDIEKLKFNTAISSLMVYVNTLQEKAKGKIRYADPPASPAAKRWRAGWDEALRTLLLLLAPFAPYMVEELWQEFYASATPRFRSIHLESWPKFNPELAQEDVVEIAVQVNGKLRGTVPVSRDEAEKQDVVEAKAQEVGTVAKYLTGKTVKKVIFVPSRLINFVV